MKKISKPLVIISIIGTIGAGAFVTNGIVSAHPQTIPTKDSLTKSVERLATTLSLDRAKLYEMLDRRKTEHASRHEKYIENRLNRLVEKGKITEEQKVAIEERLNDLPSQRQDKPDEMEKLDGIQRKKLHEERRAELEEWAAEQDMNPDELKGVLSGIRRR